MKKKNLDLVDNIKEKLGSDVINIKDSFDMVTIEVSSEKLLRTCKILKDEKIFDFAQLVDLAGIDYYS
jgi:NADH:ubiquinone oxidoreductase subunit C